MDSNKGPGQSGGDAGSGGGDSGGGGTLGDIPSLLELADDHCPKCGAVMAPDAVVCVKCGYDLRANEARSSVVGKAVEVPSLLDDTKAEPAEASGPFVRPPAGTWENERVLGAAGGVIALGGAVAAAINTPASSTSVTIGAAALALYSVLLHTGTGLAAVGIGAAIAERPYGSIRVAASRVFVAYGAFELIKDLHLDFTGGPILKIIAAGLVYFLILWGLFRRTARETGIVAVSHFIIWFVLMLSGQLYAWVQAGVEAGKLVAPGTGTAP